MKKILLLLGVSTSLFADNCNQIPGYFDICVNKKSSCEPVDLKNSCGNRYGKTFFSARPQDSNTVRRIISMPFERNRTENDEQSFLTVTGEFQSSFKSHNIGQWFFFNGCECMTVGIPSDTQKFDVDGSQLGLSLGNTDLVPATLRAGSIGTICADPILRNFIADINLQIDLCQVYPGLWLQLDFPVVWTQNNMRFCTSGQGTAQDDFPSGLFFLPPANAVDGAACADTPVVYTNILDAFCGGKEFGSVDTLKSGKYASCALSKTALAGIHIDLGYDYCVTEQDYIAAALHVVGPTGTRPQGDFVFEPVAGANKSWQLGLLFSGYHLFEVCPSNESTVGLYWCLVGTHLFKARQTRMFNLIANGPGSQYLLVKEMDAANVAFINAIERVANVFVGETRVGASLMFDGSVMLAWERGCVATSIGYNFWARTQEKRSDQVCFRSYGYINSSYGIKGNTHASDFSSGLDECQVNSDTASTSTISEPGPVEPSDDNGPVLITINDLNYNVPLHPATWSNKLFGTFTYKGTMCCQDAFASIGASVEFGHKNTALNMVGCYIQGGISY